MAIVQIEPFDLQTASPARFGFGGFWASLGNISRRRVAKLLMIADRIVPDDVIQGFKSVAVSEDALPPGVLAYRVQYEDFLKRIAREVRYIRFYLVVDTFLDDQGLAELLGTYGIAAHPVESAVPQPFVEGRADWDVVETQDAKWALLASKPHQVGSVYPRFFHRLFGLGFPIWAAMEIYTFDTQEAHKELRQKEAAAKLDDKARDLASDIQAGVKGVRAEINRYGMALHTVKLYVLCGAGDEKTLRERIEMVRGAIPLAMERFSGGQDQVARIFSTELPSSVDGFPISSAGVTVLMGSAISYRRRTETRGILIGVDQNRAPVIYNIFDDRNPSYNSVILGQTGSGKTFMVLLEMLRHLLLGCRLIITDPQGNIDLPFLGGFYHRAVIGTKEASINVLDITRDELAEQVATVKSIMKLLGVMDAGNHLQGAILDEALMDIYESIWDKEARVPTLEGLERRLEDISWRSSIPRVKEEAQLMAYRLRPYTRGSLRELFGRETTVDLSLDHAVTVFDLSRLPPQEEQSGLRAAMLAILVASINNSIRKRRRAGDRAPILFFIDEMGLLMRDRIIASYVSAEYKTARARLVGMIVADQDLHSLLGPKDEYGIHHGIPILANAAFRFIFKQSGDQLDYVRQHFPEIPESMIQGLPHAPTGTCIACLPGDLLKLHVIPSPLDRIVLSSRLQDREFASRVVEQMLQEIYELTEVEVHDVAAGI